MENVLKACVSGRGRDVRREFMCACVRVCMNVCVCVRVCISKHECGCVRDRVRVVVCNKKRAEYGRRHPPIFH